MCLSTSSGLNHDVPLGQYDHGRATPGVTRSPMTQKSALEQIVGDMIANLPKPVFAPSLLFDFDDVREAIAMIEEAIVKKQEKTQIERREAATKAAQDPFHSYVKNPIFAPMAEALWKAALTFPLILRRAMLISICSHVEHVLKQWCELLHGAWSLPRPLRAFPKTDWESDLHHSMRYIRDEAGLALADFERWPEWVAIDGYKVVRNCLAHNGGVIDRPNDRAKIAQLRHVHIEEDGLLAAEAIIFLDEQSCALAADTAKALFDRLTLVCQQDPRAQPKQP